MKLRCRALQPTNSRKSFYSGSSRVGIRYLCHMQANRTADGGTCITPLRISASSTSIVDRRPPPKYDLAMGGKEPLGVEAALGDAAKIRVERRSLSRTTPVIWRNWRSRKPGSRRSRRGQPVRWRWDPRNRNVECRQSLAGMGGASRGRAGNGRLSWRRRSSQLQLQEPTWPASGPRNLASSAPTWSRPWNHAERD